MSEQRVLKWAVPADGEDHQIGDGTVAMVGCQDFADVVMVWTIETDEHPTPDRPVRVFGTGHPIPHGYRYFIGSTTTTAGLVWHVFATT